MTKSPHLPRQYGAVVMLARVGNEHDSKLPAPCRPTGQYAGYQLRQLHQVWHPQVATLPGLAQRWRITGNRAEQTVQAITTDQYHRLTIIRRWQRQVSGQHP